VYVTYPNFIGNGQKSAAARAKNAKKADKEKKSKSGGGLAAIQKSRDAFKCIRCMQVCVCVCACVCI
jgi:hypothetical protein